MLDFIRNLISKLLKLLDLISKSKSTNNEGVPENGNEITSEVIDEIKSIKNVNNSNDRSIKVEVKNGNELSGVSMTDNYGNQQNYEDSVPEEGVETKDKGGSSTPEEIKTDDWERNEKRQTKKEGRNRNLGDRFPQEKKKNESKSTHSPPITEKRLTISSPFVEINLNRLSVSLIIPSQQIEQSKIEKNISQLNYELKCLNNEVDKTISANINERRDDFLKVERKEIELRESLKQFEIVFPDELGSGNYCYHHHSDSLYLFIPIGNDRGRMFYLYNSKGQFNPLPKREIWALIKEEFYPYPEPSVKEESWIWESYQPMLIDLRNADELVLKNKQTGNDIRIPCKSSFFLEVEDSTIQDDFTEYNPLFTGGIIKLRTSWKNIDGWFVEIQNRYGKTKVLDQNWAGDKPLEINLFQDLPSDCGEFQVFISEVNNEGNANIPVEFLTFRYVPHLNLEYPKDVLVPNPNDGHTSMPIKIFWTRDSSLWELKVEESQKIVSKKLDDGYQIEVPPDEDVVKFSLQKKDNPITETKLRITLPRLRWQILDNYKWSDKLVVIERDQIVAGEVKYLKVRISGYLIDYEIFATLKMGDERIQEEKLVKKRNNYEILLNKFYDSIRGNENELKLNIEIRKCGSSETLHSVEIIRVPKILQNRTTQAIFRIEIRPIVKGGNGKFRIGKGFSKSELCETIIEKRILKKAGIHFDRRRKSSHPDNIKRLKSIERILRNAD